MLIVNSCFVVVDLSVALFIHSWPIYLLLLFNVIGYSRWCQFAIEINYFIQCTAYK